MTSEEKLRRVLDARGYTVVATDNVYLPGDVIPGITFAVGLFEHPFSIVCETDEQDAREHCRIIGLPMKVSGRYYYRAVTD